MALSLHRGLLDQGEESVVLVHQDGPSTEEGVRCVRRAWRARLGERLDRAPLIAYPRRTRAPYSPSLVPSGGSGGLPSGVAQLRPDVVHLHWLGGGFLSLLEMERMPGPLVITLHDMWWFTGGCHYTAGCNRFRSRCGACPVLGSRHRRDLSTLHQRLKRVGLARPDVTWVATSRWIAEEARSSRVLGALPGYVVPNGIDVDVFRPGDLVAARRSLGIPVSARVVVFGAVAATSDPRKGFDLLRVALDQISSRGEGNLVALVFGDDRPQGPSLPCATRHLGILSAPTDIARAFAAADVAVVPSRQEAFGLVTAEAMACETPVVAFDRTGAEDLIEHRWTGWLARNGSAASLAEGIQWVLSDPDRARRLGRRARERVVEHFELGQVARRYRALYERVAGSPGRSSEGTRI